MGIAISAKLRLSAYFLIYLVAFYICVLFLSSIATESEGCGLVHIDQLCNGGQN